MPLSLHRAERADTLVSGLASVLAAAPADPFAPDVVAVPSKGVERWISQSLAASLGAGPGRQDGVCANVAFPSPGRLARDVLSAAWGIAEDEDPWVERRLTWPLLEVVDDCADESWCRTLGRHLGRGGSDRVHDDRRPEPSGSPEHARGRRLAVAQRLAGLFTSYGSQRPGMLRDWLEGRDTDGAGVPLDADHVWQAELWRRLRVRIDVPSPAERLEGACARVRAEPELVDLPARLSVFGPTRLATDQLRVLAALAEQRQVHLWLPHPSAALWRAVASAAPGVAPRREDPSADLPQHPLLRSCARDAREMQVRMAAEWTSGSPALPVTDAHRSGPAVPSTLLGALQHDLHQDRMPDGRHRLAAEDTSVQVHACHGRQRQVEVLREVLLGLLADDPGLELRDVIVMCPDIEAYAPLISAAFGLSADDADGALVDAHPGHRLTVRLADRSLRQTNPVLEVAARLLDLGDARVTVSEVLDLLALPPVRRRFRLDAEELERVGDWVRRSGVRWGLDAPARARFGLGEVPQNTWESGLDRVLVGVAMDEDDCRTLASVLPLGDVDSSEVDLAGRVAELLARLTAAIDDLHREQPLEGWVATLTHALDGLVEVAPGDAWQLSSARRQLADTVASADQHASSTTLRLADLRALLAERLKGRPTRANFRTGHLTMCTMVPMRSVPHRVVCLLGVDDGVFPRGARIDGDDVLTRRPLVGERDARAEDRQLFLDAVLAATERLVVLYAGADERTGAERPPAVPLGELLDVLDATAHVPQPEAAIATGGGSGGGAFSTGTSRDWTTGSGSGTVRGAGLGATVRERVLVRHPLQPFDGRNFEPGWSGAGDAPFSFDRAAHAGSRARSGDRQPRPPFLPTALPPADEPLGLPLDDLVRFIEHPVKHFLRQRLGLTGTDSEEEFDDGFPVVVGPLDKWAVGDRLLQAGLAGVSQERALLAEQLRGSLPPGPLGAAVVEGLVGEVGELVTRTSALRAAERSHVDIAVTVPSGATLTGTVPVFGDRVVRVVYSKLGPKHRLRAWLQLLALCAQRDDRPWEAVTVGRGYQGLAASRLGGLPREEASARLDELVAVYREGLRSPLPLPPRTACTYASKRDKGVAVGTALVFAAKDWRQQKGQGAMGDATDAEHQRVWGTMTLQEVLAETGGQVESSSRSDPSGEDFPDEPHRFGRLARQVWSPLLRAETVGRL